MTCTTINAHCVDNVCHKKRVCTIVRMCDNEYCTGELNNAALLECKEVKQRKVAIVASHCITSPSYIFRYSDCYPNQMSFVFFLTFRKSGVYLLI